MLIMDRNQNKIYAWTKHRIHGMIVCDGRTCNSYTVEDKKFLREQMFNMTNLELKKHANDVRLMVPSTRSPYPIDKKFEAFNFHVINVDAHDFDELRAAFKEAEETKGMPTCIVLHSLKGKGVSFMENSCDWHGKAPNDEEFAIAMADLNKIEEELAKEVDA